MIGSVSPSRRANAFAQSLEERAVEGAAPPDRDGAADDTERAGLLALAGGLESLPRPGLDPEVKRAQRAKLTAAMEAAFAEGETDRARVPEQRGARQGRPGHGSPAAKPPRRLRPRSRFGRSLAAGGLTVGVAAGAFTGVAVASTDALPGDSLYGLKRQMEALKLGLASGDLERGEAYLDRAAVRLLEARQLMARQHDGRPDDQALGELRSALSGMHHDAAEGHRLLSGAYEREGGMAPIRSLTAFSATHRTAWDQLHDRLPPQLTDVGERVSSIFSAIDSQVAPIRSGLPSAPDADDPSGADGSTHPPGGSQDGGAVRSPSAADTARGSTSDSDSDPADRDQPSPSETGTQQDGLLGGGSGLLDPPQDTSAEPSGTADSPSLSDPAPDVTLPPLLPELLPGLGLQSSDGSGSE